jgi:hypothetical protein
MGRLTEIGLHQIVSVTSGRRMSNRHKPAAMGAVIPEETLSEVGKLALVGRPATLPVIVSTATGRAELAPQKRRDNEGLEFP